MFLAAISCPDEQFSPEFISGMINRMAVGFHRYGPLKADRADWLRTAELRIVKYEETGNTEWLMDAANYLMVEFMHPKHSNAFYRATEHNESPGYIDPEGNRRTASEQKPVTNYRREGD